MPWFQLGYLKLMVHQYAQYKDQVEDLGANLTGAKRDWFSSASLHGCKFDR